MLGLHLPCNLSPPPPGSYSVSLPPHHGFDRNICPMMWSTAAPQVPRSRRVSGQRSPVDGDTSRPVISDTGISIAQKLPRLHPIGAYPRLLAKTASRTPAAAILIGAKTSFLLPHTCRDRVLHARSYMARVASSQPFRWAFPAPVRFPDAGPTLSSTAWD